MARASAGARREHEIRNIERDEIAAIAVLTAIHLDRRTRKSCPFPAALRSAVEARLAKDNNSVGTTASAVASSSSKDNR